MGDECAASCGLFGGVALDSCVANGDTACLFALVLRGKELESAKKFHKCLGMSQGDDTVYIIYVYIQYIYNTVIPD